MSEQTTTHEAESAREAHRDASGRFGVQPATEADVDLPQPGDDEDASSGDKAAWAASVADSYRKARAAEMADAVGDVDHHVVFDDVHEFMGIAGSLENIEAGWTDEQVLTEAEALMEHSTGMYDVVEHTFTAENVAAIMRDYRDTLQA